MQSNYTGRIGEGIAEKYLLNKGYELVAGNVRALGGEIDLVMRDKGTYVFVEVKTRRYGSDESAYDAVDRRKRAALSKAATQFIMKHKLYDVPCRFDCVFIVGADEKAEIQHIKNAFEIDRGRYFI